MSGDKARPFLVFQGDGLIITGLFSQLGILVSFLTDHAFVAVRPRRRSVRRAVQVSGSLVFFCLFSIGAKNLASTVI